MVEKILPLQSYDFMTFFIKSKNRIKSDRRSDAKFTSDLRSDFEMCKSKNYNFMTPENFFLTQSKIFQIFTPITVISSRWASVCWCAAKRFSRILPCSSNNKLVFSKRVFLSRSEPILFRSALFWSAKPSV